MRMSQTSWLGFGIYCTRSIKIYFTNAVKNNQSCTYKLHYCKKKYLKCHLKIAINFLFNKITI
jgi:hypothetical protein